MCHKILFFLELKCKYRKCISIIGYIKVYDMCLWHIEPQLGRFSFVNSVKISYVTHNSAL